MAKSTKKPRDFWKNPKMTEIESSRYDEEAFASKISAERNTQGHEGIRVRTASKHPYFNENKPGIWISSKINLQKWFKWLSDSLREISYKFWGKRIDTLPEQIEGYKNQINQLNNSLVENQIKLKEAEEKFLRQKQEIVLAKEVIDKFELYQQVLNEFESEVKRISKQKGREEATIKKKLTESRWILGIDCQVKASEKKVDNQLGIDLHVQTGFRQDKVFEFKSPNLEPFFRKKDDTRLLIDEELSQGLNQLIAYMRRTNIYRHLDEEGTYKIQHPLGILVMGYDLEKPQIDMIKEWNSHLRPHIQIITYNELLETGKNQLMNIKSARELEEKEIKKQEN